jgi:hypothetical protein
LIESRPGQLSRAFSGLVGDTCPASGLRPHDYLITPGRFDSEGNWAFCRFDSLRVPAVRFGFEQGGFNLGTKERAVDPDFLQLHLEVLTNEGALLWLPSGRYPSSQVNSNPDRMDLRLAQEGREIFRIQGWPEMQWHFRSEEGDLEVDLGFSLDTTTVLPDCILPQCLFAMWAATGRAKGIVRAGNQNEDVKGVVFYDHPRVLSGPNPVLQRKIYLYTTMFFADGSRILGYHALDEQDRPIPYYCFGVYIDPTLHGQFLPDACTTGLQLDADNMPERWEFSWRSEEQSIEAQIAVRDPGLTRAWGSSAPPKNRREFIIFPLVLEGQALISESGRTRKEVGLGLAEYFNQEYWPV